MSFAEEIVLPNPIDDERLAQAHRLNDGAMALRDAGKSTAVALSVARRALALVPGAPFVLSNIGLLLWDAGDMEGAQSAFQSAIDADPTNHKYHGNLGVFASAIAKPDLAEKHLTEAIRLSGHKPGPKWDHALLQLWQGKWEQGLSEYDIRREHRGPLLYPGMPYPLWQGEDLNGKTIYIQGEQGTGDRILFSRYISWLKSKYPNCTIYAHLRDDLVNLLWGYEELGIVKRFIPNGVPWPKGIDYSCFLMSLPYFHGSRREEFIPPDPGLIRDRVGRQNGIGSMPQPSLPSVKVAICWTGNPSQTRNHDRSVPLELLIELAEDPRIQLYSVQVGPGNADLDRTGARRLTIDLAPDIEREGWIGTAQVLMRMDLVITVCTSIAHLAGVLDLNCWTLLCKEPYWIWPRHGVSTAWYPRMRLYRQKQNGGWRPVIEEVKSELGRLADIQIGPA